MVIFLSGFRVGSTEPQEEKMRQISIRRLPITIGYLHFYIRRMKVTYYVLL